MSASGGPVEAGPDPVLGPRLVSGEGEPGLVSVVIPTYNRADLLPLAIRSALDQTYSRVEVVVVDDGSTDDTPAVLAGFDERVRSCRQDNAGVQAARNRAFTLCRGEFIALLDSDDVWLPWKLEVQVALLRRFPELGMVWTDMKAIDPRGEVLQERYLRTMYSAHGKVRVEEVLESFGPIHEALDASLPGPDGMFYHGDVFPHMIHGNLVHTSTVLMRRSRVAGAGGFDESLRVAGGDHEFHFRVTELGPVGFFDQPSILYRIGAADARTAPSNEVHIARNYRTVVERYRARCEERFRLSPAGWNALLAHSDRWIGEAERARGARSEAAAHLRRSLRRRPAQLRVALQLLLMKLPSPVSTLLVETKRAAKRLIAPSR